MRGFLLSLFVGFSVLITMGCSMQKDMSQMTDTTGQMSRDTQVLSGMANQLGISLPIVLGYLNMNNCWQYVISDDSGDTTKLAQAAAYYESMPYQYWTGQGSNTSDVRDDDMFTDIQFLIFNVNQYIKHSFKIPNGIGLNSDNYRILSAMSVAMSQVSPNQIRLAREGRFNVYSIYDLVVDALVNKDMYRKTTMPKHVTAILEFENEFKYLLQIRYNHLLLFATSLMTYLDDKNTFEKLWDIMTACKFSQKVELSQFSNERLQWLNEILQGAEDTRATIQQLGDKLQYSESVKKIFDAMKLIPSETKDTQRQEIETELINHMNSLAN